MADSFWKKFQNGYGDLPSKLRSSVKRSKHSTEDASVDRDSAEDRRPPASATCTIHPVTADRQAGLFQRTQFTLDYGPDVHNETIPNTLDLGLYYSEEQHEFQVAKVAQKDRATHLYVVGATGSGKTKFLEFLIRQDIINGQGLAVIDPHGDLIEDIKGFLAYLAAQTHDQAHIEDQIVLVDPTDPHLTVTFNPLEKMEGISVAEQAAELIAAFQKIWSDSWGVRMEDLLRNTLIALGEAELTLCEITPFLTRRAFREKVLQSVTNPTAQDYFERFDTLTDRSQITWIEPVMNKINAFLADERMRLMFSSPRSSFRLREIMDQRKHLLIKLDKGKLKGASDLLGSLFMAKIQMAAFSRSNIPAHQRVPFYLYIDEFQNFAAESFEVILSEARKYGLALIMAHQSLSQISENLRSLILASAGLQVYFRVNRQDAQLLAKEVFTYAESTAKDGTGGGWESKIGQLQHLSPRTAYAKHKIQGGTIELFTVRIKPPWEMLSMSEEQYQAYLTTLPFGGKYLRSREELASAATTRQQGIARLLQTPPKRKDAEPVPEPPDDDHSPQPTVSVEDQQTEPARVGPATPEMGEQLPSRPARTHSPARKQGIASPHTEPTVEREHRRLQHLIKRLAEQHGYRATIEEPTADGQGRVDVGLEQDGRKVACEISVTSTPEQELGNIQKCLASGYERVILCAEPKAIKKIQTLIATKLSDPDQTKVVFIAPEDLPFYFEEEAAGRAGTESRVKGYKVKVKFQPVEEGEKESKRQSLARVFIQSAQRKEQEK